MSVALVAKDRRSELAAIRIRGEVPEPLADRAFEGVIPIRVPKAGNRGLPVEQARTLIDSGFAEPMNRREWDDFWLYVHALMVEDLLDDPRLTTVEGFCTQFDRLPDPSALVLLCLKEPRLMRRAAERAANPNLLRAVEIGERAERRGRRKRYDRYLASPEWKAKRAEAILRAQHRCQLCNRSGELHAHHRTYVRLGRERPEDLIVLCSDCHGAFHDRRGMPVSD